MHIAVLNANTDRSAFARAWPDDAHKVIAGLKPHRPDWTYSAWQASDGELPPEDDAAHAWVITGSVASANDEAPWMLALEQRIRARHAQKLPTAGLCFGHQLIAKALGGRVGPSPGGWRLGVATTHWAGGPCDTSNLKRCSDDADHVPAPQWMQPPLTALRLIALHQEQVLVPPPGVQVLGGDGFTPNAAMAAGDHIFTTQYHPELSREFVLALLDVFADEWPAEQVAAARAQCQQEVDAPHFMGWLARFLQTHG